MKERLGNGDGGARTPEELETLLEDALLLGDDAGLVSLFETGALLAVGNGDPVRGGEAIAEVARSTWVGDGTYVADPRRVLVAGDIALIEATGATNVVRRSYDGAWRYAISLVPRPRPRPSGGDERMARSIPSYADAVSAHYSADDLGAQILANLHAAGKDVDALRVDDLAPVDQLHAGGAAATRALMRRAGLEPGMRVLDVGGGLGGPARLIAHDAGCHVTVLDLSAASCHAGEMLTARVGRSDRVTFTPGSALDAPFADGAFDRVWTQHATMNIAEKARLFGEMHRLLRPGGRLVMQEIVAGSVQPIHYPVPWAPDASISFLSTSNETRALLAAIGFRELEWVDERDAALAAMPAPAPAPAPTPDRPQAGAPALAAALMFGPRIAEMVANVGRNLREDRLSVVQAVFERP